MLTTKIIEKITADGTEILGFYEDIFLLKTPAMYATRKLDYQGDLSCGYYFDNLEDAKQNFCSRIEGTVVIQTKTGTLKATVGCVDPDYPALHIDLIKDGKTYGLLTVEDPIDENRSLCAYVWENTFDDDFSHNIIFKIDEI